MPKEPQAVSSTPSAQVTLVQCMEVCTCVCVCVCGSRSMYSMIVHTLHVAVLKCGLYNELISVFPV